MSALASSPGASSSPKCSVAQVPRFGVSSLLVWMSNASVNIKISLFLLRKVEKDKEEEEEEGFAPFPSLFRHAQVTNMEKQDGKKIQKHINNGKYGT